MEAKIGFLGLLNWDEHLFEDMSWPTPFLGENPVMDKVTFLAELAMQTAELEVLYPRPDMMKNAIRIWSRTKVDIWNRLWATTQYEYNPIENYNRYEDGTDTDTNSGTDTGTLARTGSDTTTDTPDTSNYKAAFDSVPSGGSDGLVKSDRVEGENVSETEYGSTDTNTMVHGHKLEREHEWHIHGNIGVVSTQDMIKQEREVSEFNLFDIMISDFKDRFCILVY